MQIEQRVKGVEVAALGMDPPVVVDVATPLRDVLRRMRDGSSGCALITRDGRLAGIFTERDLVERVLGTENPLERPVADWMTSDPDRVAETDSIRKAIRQVFGHNERIRRGIVAKDTGIEHSHNRRMRVR